MKHLIDYVCKKTKEDKFYGWMVAFSLITMAFMISISLTMLVAILIMGLMQ